MLLGLQMNKTNALFPQFQLQYKNLKFSFSKDDNFLCYLCFWLREVKACIFFLGPVPSLPGTDWLQNVETLKESLRLAGSGSIDLNSVDMAQFQGTIFSVYITRHIIGWLATFFNWLWHWYLENIGILVILVLHFLHA